MKLASKLTLLLIFELIFFISPYLCSAPIPVSTCIDLQNIVTNNASASYVLAQDIDCSMVASFTPVAITNNFLGMIDGQNHTIRHVRISVSVAFAAIFEGIQNATLKNINLYNCSVTSSNKNQVGVLVGSASSGSVIENCHMIGDSNANNTATCSGKFLGGMVGALDNSSIKDCTVSYVQIIF